MRNPLTTATFKNWQVPRTIVRADTASELTDELLRDYADGKFSEDVKHRGQELAKELLESRWNSSNHHTRAQAAHNPKDWSTMATLNLGIIDDDLHQAARVYAASNRLTIKQLVLECLADRLNQPAPVRPQRGAPKKEK